MPTYQYKCPECAHEFEEFQPITDSAIETCPNCQGKTRRVISGGAGLIFKGSGFYITDNRSDSYNKSAKADSGKSSTADTSKKTETKSAPTKSTDSSKSTSSKSSKSSSSKSN